VKDLVCPGVCDAVAGVILHDIVVASIHKEAGHCTAISSVDKQLSKHMTTDVSFALQSLAWTSR
jgi:hypothetical protein